MLQIGFRWRQPGAECPSSTPLRKRENKLSSEAKRAQSRDTQSHLKDSSTQVAHSNTIHRRECPAGVQDWNNYRRDGPVGHPRMLGPSLLLMSFLPIALMLCCLVPPTPTPGTGTPHLCRRTVCWSWHVLLAPLTVLFITGNQQMSTWLCTSTSCDCELTFS